MHQTKSEKILDFTGDFELIGFLLIAELERRTNSKFKTIDDFETYINAIVVDYNTGDVILTGWLYKLNTLEFNSVSSKSLS